MRLRLIAGDVALTMKAISVARGASVRSMRTKSDSKRVSDKKGNVIETPKLEKVGIEVQDVTFSGDFRDFCEG